MKLVYSKHYFNLSKIFILVLFKMAANQTQCSRLEQRSVIEFVVADECKPGEIYRMMCDVGKHIDSPVKRKVPGEVIRKKKKRKPWWLSSKTWRDSSLLIFLKKGSKVNRASHCKLIGKYFTLFIECPSYIMYKWRVGVLVVWMDTVLDSNLEASLNFSRAIWFTFRLIPLGNVPTSSFPSLKLWAKSYHYCST